MGVEVIVVLSIVLEPLSSSTSHCSYTDSLLLGSAHEGDCEGDAQIEDGDALIKSR